MPSKSVSSPTSMRMRADMPRAPKSEADPCGIFTRVEKAEAGPPLGVNPALMVRRSRATKRELVLEAKEIEEVQRAALVAVGVCLRAREGVLKAQEVEEVERARAVAIGIATG